MIDSDSTSTHRDLSLRLLSAISHLNRRYSSALPTSELFDELLDVLIGITESEYGFIGEIFSDDAGSPYLRTRAITNIARDDAWREWYDNYAPMGLEFRNLDTLFGEVIRTGEAVITNGAARHPKAHGVPAGHPALRSFMGIPLRVQGRLIGLAGMANRPEGYTEELLAALDPLLGSIAQVIETHRERIRRSELEEALRVKEERWNYALASSGDGMIDWDLESGAIYLSPQWKAMLGYGEEELPNTLNTWRERIHPKDLSPTTHALETHLAGGSPNFECEYRLLHRDGSWRWARGRGRVVTWSSEGSPRRFVGTQMDVTDARAAEEALVRAKMDALSAARAKSEFLTVVSHELRTPLNAINGMVTLLADTHLDALQRDYVVTLEASSNALLTTLNDILSLAALDSGNTRLETSSYDPRALATEVLYEMRAPALEKGLALQYDGPQEPVWLLGDAKAIRRILTHLVSIAIKFTDGGWVNVTARIDFGRICFRVEDTGIGIPEEQLVRAFEPFAQVHPTFTRNPGESGLGLAICKRLVDLLGGEIRLESVEGQGSAFEVILPAPATESPARRLASLPGPDEAIDEALRARHPCVLVAEDNPVNQKVARAFLEKLGARVDCVVNGLEAVRAVTRFPYDLLLMDCQMPVMDGYTATEHIRAVSTSAREIPVVALTADAMDSARDRCFAVGMDGYLTKPLQLSALRYALYETLILGRRDAEPVAFSQRHVSVVPSNR